MDTSPWLALWYWSSFIAPECFRNHAKEASSQSVKVTQSIKQPEPNDTKEIIMTRRIGAVAFTVGPVSLFFRAMVVAQQ
jgi:hypothetical protein